MIFNAIDILQRELSESGLSVEMGNIGEILSSGDLGAGNIIISLINIEENRISRDPQAYIRVGDEMIKKNPAVHLNLSLLFTSTRPGYTQALLDIQQVIAFFQHKSLFDHLNTALLHEGIEKLILEMTSLNLEQLQQLWSMLGGKYHPSIVYKVRMVTIDSVSDETGPLITQIHSSYYLK